MTQTDYKISLSFLLNEMVKSKDIINTILNKQSLEVDAVTGATYSSKGIINAVSDALSKAVVSGEWSITDIQISNDHGGRGHGRRHKAFE